MKAGIFFRSVLVAVICCTMMVGCKKGCRRGQAVGAGAGTDIVSGTGVAGAEASTLPERGDLMGGTQQAGMFQALYFAYDSAAINPVEQSKLNVVADYLKANPNARLLVEGHCDERGTTEYNRALGERRALAAREALIALGVDGGRIQTISYGEDRPVDPGHDEAAWAKNRRAEFVIIQ